MTDVVYTADNGYYYPTDYSVAEVSGIKVTRDSYTQITVSGTPTADAAIALTAPTAKTTPDAPTTAAAENCTTADNNDGKLTGVTTAMEYKKSDAADWTAGTGSDITGLVPGTYYVRVKATETTNASTNQELTITAIFEPEKKMTNLPVRFEHYQQNGAPGIPEDIQSDSLSLAITARKGEENLESQGMMPITPGERITSTDKFAFDVALDLTSDYTFDAEPKTFSVSAEVYNAEKGLQEPVKKYTVSITSIAPATDDKGTFYLKILVMWDDGSRPAEEKIKVYALPEDEIGAYALKADGTKEYLLFHTYDICMKYLGRDELCRGYERCFHKESPYVNPFVQP
ncbi:MAG: hypothetical protein IJU01_06100, partial [Lachnospiraceae bacterium]|nr:hypothetical protein [Lachnospiraceae bacterium]